MATNGLNRITEKILAEAKDQANEILAADARAVPRGPSRILGS